MSPQPPMVRVRGSLRRLATLTAPLMVWIAFVLAHLLLGLLNLHGPGQPIGDVSVVYKFWADHALQSGFLVGIDSMWVYPVLALVPMLLAASFGEALYTSSWLTMVMLLNAVAFGFLTGWGRSRRNLAIAWWWVGFLVLLGPIALGRVDAVTVPLAIVAVLLLGARPVAATVLLAVAAWIKVWPAAIVLAMVVAMRERRTVLAAAAATSAIIVVVALVLGSGAHVFSFLGQQAGRGLQIEAPVSTPWLWQAVAGVPGAGIYYDFQILTFQVRGEGTDVASALTTPVMAVAVAGICLLGARAVRRGSPPSDLLPPLSLALVTALIAFNKVGSPQFISWLAVPVILGLVTTTAGGGVSFRVPAALVAALAALTQVVYPYLYSELLRANPLLVTVVTTRNLLEFVLLGWAVVTLWRLSTDSPGVAGRDRLDEGRLSESSTPTSP